MLYVNKILEKILFHKHNNIDVIIVDRGFIDMKPWIDVELELDHIEGEEAKMLNSFCDSMAAKYVDHALLFMIDPHKALERHRMTTEGTIKKVSYSMNDDYLPRLYSAYEKLVHPKNRITIDGEIDVHQTHENIMKALHTSI